MVNFVLEGVVMVFRLPCHSNREADWQWILCIVYL